MAERAAVIRLRVKPDGSIQRAMRGVTDATQKANAQQIAAARKLAEIQKRELARVEKERSASAMRNLSLQARMLQAEKANAKRAADAQAKEAKRAADAKIREEERAARARERIEQQLQRQKIRWQLNSARMEAQAAERSSRAQIREAQKAHREEMRMMNARREAAKRVASTIAGMVIGGAAGALGAADSFTAQAQGRLGVSDPADTIGSAKQITDQMIRSLTAGGFSREEVSGTVSRIDEVAKRTKVSQADLAAAVAFGQERFSDPRAVIENLDLIAQLARATGGSAAAIAGYGLTAKQAGTGGGEVVNNEDMRDLLLRTLSQTGEGSIEFGNLSGEFASTIATAVSDLGAYGADNVRQITALAQVLGKSLKNPAEVATIFERFTSKLKNADVQERLSDLGVRIADKDGRITASPFEIITQMMASEKLRNPQVRQDVFKDLLGEQGAATIMTSLDRDPELFLRLATATSEQGQAMLDEVIARLDASPFSAVDQMQVDAQSVTLAGMGANDLVKLITAAAEERVKLATENPVGFELFDPIKSVLGGIGLGALGGKLFGSAGSWFGRIGAPAMDAAGTGATIASRAIGTSVTGSSMIGAGAFALPAATLAAAFLPDSAVGGAYSAAGESIANATGINEWGPGPLGLKQPTAPIDLSPATIKAIADATAASQRTGNATLRVQIDGPGRVVGTRQNEAFPAALDTGSAAGTF